jgi:hypothetical protein
VFFDIYIYIEYIYSIPWVWNNIPYPSHDRTRHALPAFHIPRTHIVGSKPSSHFRSATVVTHDSVLLLNYAVFPPPPTPCPSTTPSRRRRPRPHPRPPTRSSPSSLPRSSTCMAPHSVTAAPRPHGRRRIYQLRRNAAQRHRPPPPPAWSVDGGWRTNLERRWRSSLDPTCCRRIQGYPQPIRASPFRFIILHTRFSPAQAHLRRLCHPQDLRPKIVRLEVAQVHGWIWDPVRDYPAAPFDLLILVLVV